MGVAYKLVLNDMLPAISYVTRLDIYILFGFFTLAAISVTHAYTPHAIFNDLDMSALTLPPGSFDREQELIDLDTTLFWVFVGFWGGFNVLYVVFTQLEAKALYRRYWQDAVRQQEEHNQSNTEIIDFLPEYEE